MKKFLFILIIFSFSFLLFACGPEEYKIYVYRGGSEPTVFVVCSAEELNGSISPGEVQGCVFEGWFLDSGYTQKVNSLLSINISDGMSLYAKWTIVDFVELETIRVVSCPDRIPYTEGNNPDFSQLTVEAVYSDGSVRELSDEVIIAFIDGISYGENRCYIIYEDAYLEYYFYLYNPNVTENPGGENPGNGEEPGGENPGNGEEPGGENPGSGEEPGGENPGSGEEPGSNEPLPERLELSAPPAKTVYFEGQEIDFDGLSFNLVFSDGSSILLDIDAEELCVSLPYGGFRVGTHTISFYYQGFTCGFEVEFLENSLTELRIASYPILDIFENEADTWSPHGLKVEGIYADGKVKEIVDYTLIRPDRFTEGLNTITIQYSGFSINFEVRLTIIHIERLIINTDLVKLSYNAGERFNDLGLEVLAEFSDRTIRVVYDYEISAPDMSIPGIKTIVVSYMSLSETFNILVNQP